MNGVMHKQVARTYRVGSVLSFRKWSYVTQ